MNAKFVVRKGHREGETIPLGERKKVIIGRDISCDIQMFDKGLSRNHTIIEQRGNSYFISDLSSTNGTYVNGNLILTKELQAHDVVRVGNTELQFLLETPPNGKTSSVRLVEELSHIPSMISKRLNADTLSFLKKKSNDSRPSPSSEPASKNHEEAQNQALLMIYEIGNLINAEKDLQKLFNLIMNLIMERLRAYRGYLLLLHKDGELFEPVVICRGKDDDPQKELTLSKTIVREATKQGKSVLTSDASSDERFKGNLSVHLNDIQSVMCAPLESHQKILGAIYVDSRGFSNSFTEFDLELLTAIGKQAGIAIERTQLIKQLIEKEKLKHSLLVAQDIQRSFLPRDVPDLQGFDIIGVSISCDETGGDYYDFVPFHKNQLGIVIGDVSGHGIGPALVMATTRAYLRAFTQQTKELPQILAYMNALLTEDMGEDRFATLIYGKLDVPSRKFTYSSAGHDEPLFYQASSDIFSELPSTGLPLGMFPEQEYPEGNPIYLNPGDILVLCTDGVWEAANRTKEAFGKERLKTIIRKNKQKSANQLVTVIYESVKNFAEGLPLKDDITIVVLKAK
jgi:sigma-B regulation protein RsbU (phosphoserine phosphatase)